MLDRKPDVPTIEIRSPFGGKAFMTDIIVSGDVGFVLEGRLEIWRGALKLQDVKVGDQGDRNPQQLKVQTSGQLWDANDPLRFYLWTVGGTEARIRVYLAADLAPIPATSSVTEADPLAINILRSSTLLDPNTAVAFCRRARAAADAFEGGSPEADALRALANGFTLAEQATRADSLDSAGLTEWAAELRALNETAPSIEDYRDGLFPRRIYNHEEHARLVNMHGNRNAVFTLAAAPRLNGGFSWRVLSRDYELPPTMIFQGNDPVPGGLPRYQGGSFTILDLDDPRAGTAAELDFGEHRGPGSTDLTILFPAQTTFTFPASGETTVTGPDGRHWRVTWVTAGMRLEFLVRRRDRIGDVPVADAALSFTQDVTSGAPFTRTSRSSLGGRYALISLGLRPNLVFRIHEQVSEAVAPPTVTVASNGSVTAYDRRGQGGAAALSLEVKVADGTWSPLRTQFLWQDAQARAGSQTIGADVGGPLLPSGPAVLRAVLTAGTYLRPSGARLPIQVENRPGSGLPYSMVGVDTSAGLTRIP